MPIAKKSAGFDSGHRDEVARLLTETRQHLLPTFQAAIVGEAEARARRVELEKSLEGLALDSATISGDASVANVDGTPINLDVMRSCVVQLARESARAATLRQNIATVMELLANHAQHFDSDLVFTCLLYTSPSPRDS